MKIGTTRPQQPGAAARPRGAGGGGAAGSAGFAAQVGGGRSAASAGGTGPASPGTPLASLGALLAVQEAGEVGDGVGRRRRAVVRRGHALLDRLDDLRLALLDGAVPAPALRRIAALLEDRAEAADDPHLAAVLHEIEIRAAVELAKLEHG